MDQKEFCFIIYAGTVWPSGYTGYLVHMTGTIKTQETALPIIEKHLKTKIKKALQINEKHFKWLNVVILETPINTLVAENGIHVDTLIEFYYYEDDDAVVETGFKKSSARSNREAMREVNKNLSNDN